MYELLSPYIFEGACISRLTFAVAHCKQMNHSSAFWKVRDTYAGELKTLWARGYTGEGMWSRGITLVSGQYERDSLDAGEVLPEHLCGGTYRSSGKRKRKRKEKTTYKEREERRIAKRFGTNGLTLGADEETKAKLENGKRTAAKPRVAGSARGRELRAAAALARFETKKQEQDEDGGEDSESETDSENEGDGTAVEAVDINGKKLLDRSGRGMVKVCEDEDKSGAEAQNEMSELRGFEITRWAKPIPPRSPPAKPSAPSKSSALTPAPAKQQDNEKGHDEPRSKATPTPHSQNQSPPSISQTIICPICSLQNPPTAPTCTMCANVLDPARVPSIWRCQSEICKDGDYVNAGDCGVCGVCGAKKCSVGI